MGNKPVYPEGLLYTVLNECTTNQSQTQDGLFPHGVSFPMGQLEVKTEAMVRAVWSSDHQVLYSKTILQTVAVFIFRLTFLSLHAVSNIDVDVFLNAYSLEVFAS